MKNNDTFTNHIYLFGDKGIQWFWGRIISYGFNLPFQHFVRWENANGNSLSFLTMIPLKQFKWTRSWIILSVDIFSYFSKRSN